MSYLVKLVFLIILLPSTLLSEQAVRIGISTDLTGFASYWGLQTQVGARVLSDELKGSKIPLKIIIEDHNLKPKNAISAVQKLLFSDKVDALYSEFSPTTIPAASIAKNEKKLFFGVCAATSYLELNPYSFKSYIDYKTGCREIAKYWKKKGLTRVAALKAETEYGELCVEGLKEIYSDSLVVAYNYGEEVRTSALKIKKANIEAVINASFEGDMLNMLDAFSTISYSPFIAANFDAITKSVLKKYSSYQEKFVSFGFENVSPDFISKVRKIDLNNSLVSVEAAALAYIHLKQIYEAVRGCKQGDVQCQIDKLSSAKKSSNNIIGFEKFSNRQAVFNLGIKGYSKGIGTFISYDS